MSGDVDRLLVEPNRISVKHLRRPSAAFRGRNSGISSGAMRDYYTRLEVLSRREPRASLHSGPQLECTVEA